MLKKLFIIALFTAGLTLQSCNTADSQSINVVVKDETPKLNENTEQQNVEFKGVRFSYNPQVFGRVEPKEIIEDHPLQVETDKPGENFPKNTAFYFKDNSKNKGRIVIIPLENYRKMYAVSKGLTNVFDEKLRDLQKVLVNKPFRKNGEIPFLPFYDASQAFIAKVKQIPFQNGKSICFLTQYEQETSLITNEGIAYYCQGFTDDKTNYVLAEFPVSASFLPDSYTEKFEDYKMSETPWNMNKSDENQYKNYISKITKRLEDLTPEKYEPSLNNIEEIISSLKIEK